MSTAKPEVIAVQAETLLEAIAVYEKEYPTWTVYAVRKVSPGVYWFALSPVGESLLGEGVQS